MNEQKLPNGWKLVPVEPTEEMLEAKPKSVGIQGQSMQSMQRNADRAKYAAMLAAAPSAPAWSAATAPGPDGYQRTVQVPGMPSAARDEALEEAALMAQSIANGHHDACAFNAAMYVEAVAHKIRALKSIAAPVAAPVDVEFKRLADTILQATTNGTRLEALRNMAELFDRSAPVQQTAPLHWTGNVFHGDPPLPHASWDDWMADATQSRVISGVTIRQVGISDYSPTAPAPVQQAAPSDVEKVARALAIHAGWEAWDTAMDCTHTLGGNDPEEERDYFRGLAKVAMWTAPAQPAGLSEQDKLDAERYRFGCSVDGERAGLDWPSKEELDQIIDAAILAAKAAP